MVYSDIVKEIQYYLKRSGDIVSEVVGIYRHRWF